MLTLITIKFGNISYFSYFCIMKKIYEIPKIGEIFDYWTVINNEVKNTYGSARSILCKCKCGKESYVQIPALINKLSKGCPCRALDKNREKRTYVGDISETFWGRIKKSAKIRKLEFDISKEYAWELFLKQNKKCKLSDIDIIIEKSISRKKGCSNITASLDRIDSSLGYIEGNVQWVHKDINYIKQDLNEDYFKSLCKLITNKWKN